MIKTRSAFTYGFLVNYDNDSFMLSIGIWSQLAKIKHGTYSFTEYAAAVQTAIADWVALYGSGEVFTVTANRDRTLNIVSDSSSFTIDPSLVGAAISACPMLGITTALTGTDVTTGLSGSEYVPQYYLQEYVSLDSNLEYENSSENISASGIIEAVVYNSLRRMECNIKFITDLEMSGSIDNNPTGYQDAVDFMTYCITKGKIEFIPDVNDRSTFHTLILEKASGSFAFKIKEESEFKHIYQTGNLRFREA